GGRRVKKKKTGAVLKVEFPAGFDDRHVGVHHHVLGAGERLDPGTSGVVVEVCVADQEDLDVAELEAEVLDARFELRDVLLEVAVDQDQAVRRRDEVAGEGSGADVVEIPGDMEGWKGLGPRRIDLRGDGQGRSSSESN